jgi:hypothetical protein
VEWQEVHNEERNVDTIKALEDQFVDWQLAAWHCWWPKKWTESNGGFRKKLATTRRLITCRVVPALCKGCTQNRPQGKFSNRKPESLDSQEGEHPPECNNLIRSDDMGFNPSTQRDVTLHRWIKTHISDLTRATGCKDPRLNLIRGRPKAIMSWKQEDTQQGSQADAWTGDDKMNGQILH